MAADPIRPIAQAVLYEGYLLWPYRRSAHKNQQRWSFGGLFPQAYSLDHGDEPWLSQTQCLIEADERATIDVQVRFLHLIDRQVEVLRGERLEPVPELVLGAADTATGRYLSGEESTEREMQASGVALGDLVGGAYRMEIGVPAGQDVEWLTGAAGRRVGAVRRSWQPVRGRVEITAEPLPSRPPVGDAERGPRSSGRNIESRCFRLTLRTTNTTPCPGGRPEAMARSMLCAHTILHSDAGEFVSLMDPPQPLGRAAADCRNIGAWPVLVGEEGRRHDLLSAPIILYDYPQIAPESPGDLFDATEIDGLLTLSILTLTDEEQREMRDGDPKAREILDRCASLTPEQLMRLGGALREVRERPPTSMMRASERTS